MTLMCQHTDLICYDSLSRCNLWIRGNKCGDFQTDSTRLAAVFSLLIADDKSITFKCSNHCQYRITVVKVTSNECTKH